MAEEALGAAVLANLGAGGRRNAGSVPPREFDSGEECADPPSDDEDQDDEDEDDEGDEGDEGDGEEDDGDEGEEGEGEQGDEGDGEEGDGEDGYEDFNGDDEEGDHDLPTDVGELQAQLLALRQKIISIHQAQRASNPHIGLSAPGCLR